MSASNEFTWNQRGRIDFISGVPFSGCPVKDDMVNRTDWEEGWMDGFNFAVNIIVRVTGETRQAVLVRLQARL